MSESGSADDRNPRTFVAVAKPQGELIVALFQPPSPLDRIPDLETVPPEKVKVLEDHLARNVIPKVTRRILEDHKRATVLRRMPLVGRIRI